MHLKKCFSGLGYRFGDFAVSERLPATPLALPVYPELADDDIIHVCETVREFYS
jgi:dTDP-4-amino-4,6-dideoxygalactose transaminase